MDSTITFTLNDIAAICALILALSAVFALVIKIIDRFKAPDKRQDERITALEEAVKHINERLELGNKRFAADTKQLTDLEEATRNTNKIMLESLQVLIEHNIDGNNIKQLKEMKKKLDRFLLERR